jgi:hypothetical protein
MAGILYTRIELRIDGEVADDDLEQIDTIDIDDALVALEEALPELPQGARWVVKEEE